MTQQEAREKVKREIEKYRHANIADEIGIGRSTFTTWLSGNIEVGEKTLNRILDHFSLNDQPPQQNEDG